MKGSDALYITYCPTKGCAILNTKDTFAGEDVYIIETPKMFTLANSEYLDEISHARDVQWEMCIVYSL